MTLDGFCHLLDAVESEIKRSSTRTELHCYMEDTSPLPDGVYWEIIELVFLAVNELIAVIVCFELNTKTSSVLNSLKYFCHVHVLASKCNRIYFL